MQTRNECGKRDANINQFKYKSQHSNQSGIHLNKSGTNCHTETLLFALSKFDC